jgi:hypothetical protein
MLGLKKEVKKIGNGKYDVVVAPYFLLRDIKMIK